MMETVIVWIVAAVAVGIVAYSIRDVIAQRKSDLAFERYLAGLARFSSALSAFGATVSVTTDSVNNLQRALYGIAENIPATVDEIVKPRNIVEGGA